MGKGSHASLFVLIVALSGCGGGDAGSADEAVVASDQFQRTGGSDSQEGCGSGQSCEKRSPALMPTTPENLDRTCDRAEFPSDTWTTCEARNFARTLEAPAEQTSLAFNARFLEQSAINISEWTQRSLDDPSWLDPRSGNTLLTPLCATHGQECVGDPFRYPDSEGPDGRSFYEQEAQTAPFVFYDRDCARISGHVWMPRNRRSDELLPAVVITNGSVQAPETAYSSAVQSLVRAGYVVMTWDPRGQGRSDFQAPNLEQGSNINPRVFWEGLVDAIDFFRSTPDTPYPHESACSGTYPTETQSNNPFWDAVDPDRLGIVGHSLGAIAVSVVQGYGAPGAEPWPGELDETNPVDVAVAWDSLITPEGKGLSAFSDSQLPPELYDALILISTQGVLPDFQPRVPAMTFFADYAVAPTPYLMPPDPEQNKVAYETWRKADVPVYALGFQGTTHFDFSLLPQFPATSWCPDTSSGACRGGWGWPSIEYYTVAWFDRWLKQPGEPGFASADQRLIDDAWEGGAKRMSFHYRSARDFPDRRGFRHECESIRDGCEAPIKP